MLVSFLWPHPFSFSLLRLSSPMVVRLRLQRWGNLHRPFYRIAIADSRRHVSKKVIEYLGTYDPLVDRQGLKHLRLNIPRTKYWLAVGAQPSDTLKRLLANFSILPLPPSKSRLPAEVGLMNAMVGRGAVGEVMGREEGEGRQVRTAWLYPSSKGIPYDDTRRLEDMAREREKEQRFKAGEEGEVREEVAGKKKFPFTIAPTPVTLTAWQVAQKRYQRSIIPAVAFTLPPPPSPSPAAELSSLSSEAPSPAETSPSPA